jgi:hypothetical protein
MSPLPTAGALGTGFRCISLDLPGFGDPPG